MGGVEHWENFILHKGVFTYKGNFLTIKKAYEKLLLYWILLYEAEAFLSSSEELPILIIQKNKKEN
jgi:hypothetical protein